MSDFVLHPSLLVSSQVSTPTPETPHSSAPSPRPSSVLTEPRFSVICIISEIAKCFHGKENCRVSAYLSRSILLQNLGLSSPGCRGSSPMPLSRCFLFFYGFSTYLRQNFSRISLLSFVVFLSIADSVIKSPTIIMDSLTSSYS